MNPLITITTDEQGSSVVSARELHEFLQVRTRFADWFKNRVRRYSFRENVDYVKLYTNVETRGLELDYALTLDMAKQLSMVERTRSGKAARLYFIECERRVQVSPLAADPLRLLAQLLQQQSRLLTEQSQRIDTLEQRLPPPEAPYESLDASPPVGPLYPSTPPHLRAPASLRRSISRRINAYCDRWEVSQGEMYGYLYKRLQEVYGVNVYQLIRTGQESLLDAVERYDHLERLDSLVTAELDCHQ